MAPTYRHGIVSSRTKDVVLRIVLAAALGCAGLSGCATATVESPALADSVPCDPAELGATAKPGEPAPVNDFGGVSFSCSTLRVPLDHRGLRSGPVESGDIALRVAVADNANAPRGVLVRLIGGPGVPGVALASDITAHEIEPSVKQAYRVVFLNQRGTGPNALQCPQLQQALGASDLALPPPGSVQACAHALGEARRFYTTADSVADLEALRVALGVDKLTLDGSSYGSLFAERYALAHPDRVAALVLDSVVPHDGLDLTGIAVFPRAAQVLAMACRETHCTTDPAHDLAQVVHARHNGPQLLDLITGLTSGKPRLTTVAAVLHAAAGGDYTALDTLIAGEHKDAAVEAAHLSQGLHTASVCEDLLAPWTATTPIGERGPLAARAIAGLPDTAFFPFDRDTATGNGAVRTCLQWPATEVAPFQAGRMLPPVPTLLLAGDHDLNTPLAWTQQEAARAPHGTLVVIPGSGHITQNADNGPAGRQAVAKFLTATP
ncbi:alpha/beta fold hydrolase [Pseudonocardia spinosispora]|uniref:alpha/beta fold hydrolase n=1 Tax=Pseudonocardia spinosispora TaxID=103441 RepID=UPI000423304F|nr:alpha/beta hydrolase [Pseudonocardia spinosispora]